jgi:hypothetical protein
MRLRDSYFFSAEGIIVALIVGLVTFVLMGGP